jgi:hypothetical protein
MQRESGRLKARRNDPQWKNPEGCSQRIHRALSEGLTV